MPGQPVTVGSGELVDIEASLDACARQNAGGAVKVAEDLARYEHIIATTRPEVIVECGTWMGGSARWFLTQPGVAEVVTVDVSLDSLRLPEPIRPVVGDSADPSVAARVRALVNGRRCMVSLDSDHSAAHVAREIELYGPLVTPGCHLVVEDGIARWMSAEHHANGSPLDAIEALLMDNPAWRRDEHTEAMFPVSMSPAGWWTKHLKEVTDGD